jgi:hypothetical protein
VRCTRAQNEYGDDRATAQYLEACPGELRAGSMPFGTGPFRRIGNHWAPRQPAPYSFGRLIDQVCVEPLVVLVIFLKLPPQLPNQTEAKPFDSSKNKTSYERFALKKLEIKSPRASTPLTAKSALTGRKYSSACGKEEVNLVAHSLMKGFVLSSQAFQDIDEI